MNIQTLVNWKMNELKNYLVWERWAARFARFALGAAFLSAVAGRFGLWNGQFNWSLSENFITRTAELNAWSPSALIPLLGWSSTIAETTFAVMLITGIGVRWAAFGSAILLFCFASAMLIFTGFKPPLDYSVFSASACALLLALYEHRAAALSTIGENNVSNANRETVGEQS